MHPLQKQFHDHIQAHQLVKKADRVLLAVSGGLDSMVMARLFHESGFTFAVAHCNFNLRGAASDGDEQLVKEWTEAHNVPFHVRSFDLGQGSTQLNARNARYRWFDELADEFGYTKIATAHHLNDSLETALINLARGTGIKGMAGITPVNGRIIRPVLFATKATLRDFAEVVAVPWREDASNATTDYDRNFLRHEVIPRLQELNPSLVQTFHHTSERLQGANKLIQKQVEEIQKKYLSEKNGLRELSLEWMKEPEDVVILSGLLAAYGCNYVTCKEIFEARKKPGKKFQTEEWEIMTDRNRLYVRPVGYSPFTEMEIDGPGVFQMGDQNLSVELQSSSELTFTDDKSVAMLDAQKIRFPLTVRRWKEGDRFYPLGMKGSKKVSDFLVDEKVPLALKDKVLVLESNREIVWLIGYRVSEVVRVREGTEEVVRMEVK